MREEIKGLIQITTTEKPDGGRGCVTLTAGGVHELITALRLAAEQDTDLKDAIVLTAGIFKRP